MNCHIVHNDLLCVASFTLQSDQPTSVQSPKQSMTQMQVTRYFFSQFWCEFTKKVLSDFLSEDLNVESLKA